MPSEQSLQKAREVILTDLRLAPSALLSVLADNWQELARLGVPHEGGTSLLAFAEHLLLEPVIGACALIWSALESPPDAGGGQSAEWDEWSPWTAGGWSDLVRAELARLGRTDEHVPDDADEAAALLASTRADVIDGGGPPRLVAASMVRTCGWPRGTEIIAPLADRALELALLRIQSIDPETDNDEIIEAIERRLMPPDEVLARWVGNLSFGRLGVPAGSAGNGTEVLREATRWLTWSLAVAAVEVVVEMRSREQPAPERHHSTKGTTLS